MHVCTCMYVGLDVYAYIYMAVYVVCMSMHTCVYSVYMCMHVYLHTCVCGYM